MDTNLLIVLIVIVAILLGLFFRKSLLNYFTNLSQKAAEEKSKEIFKDERERLTEQLDAKKDVIKELMDKIDKRLSETQKEIVNTEKDRIKEFSSLKSVIEEHKITTAGLKESADHLKNILSNNQLRGSYGEEIAENLLKTVGFVRGENYVANESQDTVSTRPDFTIFLPDRTKINVDAKFPLSALVKYQEASSDQERDRYLKEFSRDVGSKIKQVTNRDYINPEEKTVDFVILFVPNEMIFSFIYDKLNEVWNDAMNKKVVLAGPFGFTAILRMVFQSYKNFKYQENLYEIIKLIKVFEQEYEKFNKELDNLGNKLESAQSQYQKVSITRTKKLSGVIEKIKMENITDNAEFVSLDRPQEEEEEE